MSINTHYQNIQQKLKANTQINTEPSIESTNEILDDITYDWDRSSLDFGYVAPGSVQKYNFSYLGNQKISGVRAGCGCTSTVLDDNTISGNLTLAKDYSYAKDRIVNVEKHIMVTLEDENKTTTTKTLYLTCKVDKSAKPH